MRDFDRVVGEIAAEADPQLALPARARDRAMAAALATTVVPAATPARRRWTVVLIPAGLAVAAAAAIAIVVMRAPAPADHHGDALPVDRVVAIGHARVHAQPESLAFATGTSGVFVMSGSVHVDVDPEPRRPFQVRTHGFVVDVLGTAFTVSTDGVVVERGAVRVLSPTGQVLDERVAAGERWSVAQAATAPEPEPEAEAEAEEIEIELEPDEPAPAAPRVDHRALLKRARALQIAGDIDGARAVVARLLDASPSRGVRAQAEILVAETYLGTQPEVAIARYTTIADRYRGLAVAETALYAAAHNSRAKPAAARKLFERYLERYPDGSLAAEARKALDNLAPR